MYHKCTRKKMSSTFSEIKTKGISERKFGNLWDEREGTGAGKDHKPERKLGSPNVLLHT